MTTEEIKMAEKLNNKLIEDSIRLEHIRLIMESPDELTLVRVHNALTLPFDQAFGNPHKEVGLDEEIKTAEKYLKYLRGMRDGKR